MPFLLPLCCIQVLTLEVFLCRKAKAKSKGQEAEEERREEAEEEQETQATQGIQALSSLIKLVCKFNELKYVLTQ